MPSEIHVVEGSVVPQLPGWEHASIPEAKLEGYVLCPEREKGGNKARVFSSALGLAQQDSPYLREQIQEGLSESEAVLRKAKTDYGQEWEVLVPVEGRNELTRYVATKWFIPNGSHPRPRLSTLYVEKSPRKLREVKERYARRKAEPSSLGGPRPVSDAT